MVLKKECSQAVFPKTTKEGLAGLEVSLIHLSLYYLHHDQKIAYNNMKI